MKNQIIELTNKLISYPSISPIDYGCQDFIISRLKKIGFFIEKININNTSNFFAYKKGTLNKKTMLFLGHTDVVDIGESEKWLSPPFQATIKNNIIFGRGIADMKGAISSMIIATEKFIKKNPYHRNRIAFLITSDEESDGTDGTIKVVNKLIKRQEKIDYCLVGEPTSKNILGDTIKNGRRGSLNINLTIHGIEGHVAYSKFAINPIHKVLPFLNKLVNMEWSKKKQLFPNTKIQITNFTVKNSSSNIIPRNCFIQFNLRFDNQLKFNIFKNKICNLLNYFKINYSIFCKISGFPFITKKGKFIRNVANSIKEIKKINTKISTDGGTSDGRFIAKMGAEIVELGLLNKTIHKTNECAKITDLIKLSKIYYLVLEKTVF